MQHTNEAIKNETEKLFEDEARVEELSPFHIPLHVPPVYYSWPRAEWDFSLTLKQDNRGKLHQFNLRYSFELGEYVDVH